jgi:O-antigen/teichoic acid export membrane protein
MDRDTLLVAMGVGASSILSLIFTTAAARMLGAEATGDFMVGVFAISFALTASGPLNGTASRFAAEHRVRAEDGALRALPRSLAIVASMGVATGLVILALVSAAVGNPINSTTPWFSAFTLAACLALPFVSIVRGVFRGLGHFSDLNMNVVFEAGIRVAAGLALVYAFRSASAGLLGYAIAATASLVLGWRRIGRIVGPGRSTPIVPWIHLRFLLPMALMTLIYAGFQNLDVILVRSLFDASEAGAYGAAAIIAHLTTMLLTPFSTTLLPRASKIYGRQRELGREGGILLVRSAAGYLMVCSLPLVFFALAGEWIMTTLYGATFESGGSWLMPLAASTVIGGIGLLVMQCLAAQGRFGFLVPYAVGLTVAFGWILGGASNPVDVAWILFRVKLITLGVLVLMLLRSLHAQDGPQVDLNTQASSPDASLGSSTIPGAGR